MKSMKKKWKRFRTWKKNIYDHKDKIDLGRSFKLPLKTKLKYNLLGFTDQEYFGFDLEHNDYHQYICYNERLNLEGANGRFAYPLGEKLTFERTFGEFVNVPHIYWWNRHGEFIDPDLGNTVNVIEALKQAETLILKPTRSNGGGYGIHRADYNGGRYLFDQTEIAEKDLIGRLRKMNDCIAVQFIRQSEYSEKIFPYTTNSIRIATGVLKDEGPTVLFAFHRYGSKTTGVVDNISSGGVFTYVDENGVQSAGRSLLDLSKTYATHPDTGAQIEGIEIPSWETVCDMLLNAQKRFPYLKFIAWDVVIGKDGKPYILEINRGSDLSIQMIMPLRNEKLGRFMRENGMLSKKIDK